MVLQHCTHIGLQKITRSYKFTLKEDYLTMNQRNYLKILDGKITIGLSKIKKGLIKTLYLKFRCNERLVSCKRLCRKKVNFTTS